MSEHAPTSMSHFRATRLPVGDVVMSVTHVLNPVHRTPSCLQLRIFRASADSRLRLHGAVGEDVIRAEGGLAWVMVDLACDTDGFPWHMPAARVARITEFLLAGEDADERRDLATVGVGDWILGAIEHELVFAGWYAISGDARAFAMPDDEPGRLWPVWRDASDYGRWTRAWLGSCGYATSADEPGEFTKVLLPGEPVAAQSRLVAPTGIG